MSTVRLYVRQVKISLQNLWVYRWDFFGDFIRFPITIAMHLLIFIFLFSDTSIITGYTRTEGITYILIVSMISRSLSQRGIANMMELKILRGELTNDLALPVNLSLFNFSRRVGYPIYLTVISIVIFTLSALFFPATIILASLPRAILTVAFALTAMLIQMQIYYIVGILTFWLKSVGFITRIISHLQELLGGRYFPLSWLPVWIFQFSIFLPFIQMYYIPVTIYLSKETISLWFLGFQMLAWLVGLQLFLGWLEKKGLERFDGEGG